ncbi:MAG: 2-oxoglutarate dehydrogenase E1 component [Candidatus Deianiraeaceae bacterium]|jgi:2-oxoglutarate dehydrogenase E1 component
MFYSTNLAYIAELYTKFLQNPQSVDKSWKDYFQDNTEEMESIKQDLKKSCWNTARISIIGNKNEFSSFSKEDIIEIEKKCKNKEQVGGSSEATLQLILTTFREFGHLASNLDPLGLKSGYIHESLERALKIGASYKKEIEKIQAIYCGNIGYEVSHVKNEKERQWLNEQIEDNPITLTNKEKITAYEYMFRAETFEKTLHKKFPGAKRFSIEGAEGTIVALESVMLEASNNGAEQVVLGMAHRGRLNTLVHTTGKPYHAIFSEFAGVSSTPEGTPGSGDVKYHLGCSRNRKLINGKGLYVTLTPNPSHLESVNSVAMGRVRAKQEALNGNTKAVVPIIIHGNAAMSGQGVVYECFQMANLQGYTVGGTIHITINNQVGFTATQSETKSSTYCTDVAKVIDAPIFHVNGNDAIAIAKVSKLAALYRQLFQKDVVIEIFCYRKYGHNEGDEPFFTQPVMYKKIKELVTPAQVYREQISAEIGIQKLDDIDKYVKNEIDSEFEKSKTYKPDKADWLGQLWGNIKVLKDIKEFFNFKDTQISQDIFDKVGGAISSVPETFDINSKVRKLIDARQKALLSGKGIDWGTAELLAYGSLVLEGHNVRLSGEDCERGTFSHRHSVYYNQKTQEKYCPLSNITGAKGKYNVHNSLLSEFAVLGYEYGHSMTNPNDLTVWEAQFGDFANGAVTIHDQYISSGEDKWLRMSGLVNLLPHGYEGQGSEHSSARLERFLTFCAQNNIIVANCTTPANLFHILRRQVKMPFRKPLIVMSPKSLLRHPLVVSNITDFTRDSFQDIISDDKKDAQKVVITSGKVYYDILSEREKTKSKVAIIRIEQYYPFNSELLKSELKKFKNVEKICWLQEEPKNMGAWCFIRDYLQECTKISVEYCGRIASPSPATGFASVHAKEQIDIITKALKV